MKPKLLEILRCPVCRKELTLSPSRQEGTEVLEGTLTCTGCGASYPIADGIPDMLPPAERD